MPLYSVQHEADRNFRIVFCKQEVVLTTAADCYSMKKKNAIVVNSVTSEEQGKIVSSFNKTVLRPPIIRALVIGGRNSLGAMLWTAIF